MNWLTSSKRTTSAPQLGVSGEPSPELLSKLRQSLDPQVDSQLRQGGEEGCTDACLRRWLMARKLDVAAAAKDLTQHAAWRVKYVPNGFISEAEVGPQIAQQKAFLPGVDKQGRAILLLRAGLHIPTDDIHMVKKMIIYAFDAAVRACDPVLNPHGWVVGVMDLGPLAYKNLDLAGLKAVFTVAQKHYPERLSVMYLHEAPIIFYGLWKAVQPFVDPVTKQKVQFTYKKDGTDAALRELAAPEVLPTDLGGTCQALQSIEHVVARQRAACN